MLPKHDIAELLQVDDRKLSLQIFHAPSFTNAGVALIDEGSLVRTPDSRADGSVTATRCCENHCRCNNCVLVRSPSRGTSSREKELPHVARKSVLQYSLLLCPAKYITLLVVKFLNRCDLSSTEALKNWCQLVVLAFQQFTKTAELVRFLHASLLNSRDEMHLSIELIV